MRVLRSFIFRVERDTGIPGRFIIPVLVASLSLTVAREPVTKAPTRPRRLAHA
jgi:hypothetical protein